MVGESPLKKLINTIWKNDAYFVITFDGNIKESTAEEITQKDAISSLIVDSKPYDNINEFKTAITEAIDGLMCLKYQTNKKFDVCSQIYNALNNQEDNNGLL